MDRDLSTKKTNFYFYLVLLVTFFASTFCFSALANDELPERPNPPRLVNDFANLMQQNEQAELEETLLTVEKQTGTQLAIVSVKDIGDYEISDYATQLAHAWGVGDKEKDTGVLILVASGQRKIFIATGYGAEDRLTDARSKRIIENIIKPNFAQGQFYLGLKQASGVISQVLSGDISALPKERERTEKPNYLGLLILLIISFYVLSAFVGSSRTIGGRRGYYGPIFLPGDFGSGGFGDFSSGSGGFGGFGGGDFGGGGAGGEW